MADDRLRALRRRFDETGLPEDEAALLREEVRAGRVDAAALALAAYLGHPAAQQAHEGELPEPEGEGWERRAAWVVGVERWGGRPALYRAGAAIVRAIPIHCDRFDGPDDRLLEVMDLLEDWILEPGPRAEAPLVDVPAWLDDAVQQGWGAVACANAAERLYRAVLEPEQAANHVRQLALEASERHTWGLERALLDELGPWALGRGDPLRSRPRVGGALLGRVGALVRGIVTAGERAAVVDSRGRLSEWDLDAGARVRDVGAFGGDVYGLDALAGGWVAFDPGGRLRWLPREGGELPVVSAEVEAGIAAVAALDDTRVATACGDGTLRVFRLRGDAWEELRAWDAHAEGARSVAARGGLLVSGGRDATAQVWDADGAALGPRLAHEGRVEQAVWLDDARLATFSEDRALQVWGRDGLAPRWRRTGLESAVHDLVADAAGARLAGVCSDGAVRRWDAGDGRERGAWWPRGVLLRGAYAPDGRLVVGARKGTLRTYPPGT